jgi:O-antigen ligase
MLLAVGLPVAIWLGLDRRGWQRWAGGGVVLLFAGEIAASGSRGAILAGFAGAILTALVLGPSIGVKLGVAAALVVLAVACAETSRFQHRLKETSPPATRTLAHRSAGAPRGAIDAETVFRLEDEIGHPPVGTYRSPVPRTLFGSSGRGQAWAGGIDQGAERPLLGYGFGTEGRVFVDRYYALEGGFPESSYIGLFLQLGAAGLVALVGLILALAWSAVRLLRGTIRTGRGGPAAGVAGVLVAAVLIGISQSGLTSVGNIAAASIWFCALTLPALEMARS